MTENNITLENIAGKSVDEKQIMTEGIVIEGITAENIAIENIATENIAAECIAAESISENSISEKEIVEQVIAEKINAELCEVCGKELYGDLGVSDIQTPYGWAILIGETSPRNWICCDSCNAVVCHDCCEYPYSGYCNNCVKRYDLYDYIKEKFPI